MKDHESIHQFCIENSFNYECYSFTHYRINTGTMKVDIFTDKKVWNDLYSTKGEVYKDLEEALKNIK